MTRRPVRFEDDIKKPARFSSQLPKPKYKAILALVKRQIESELENCGNVSYDPKMRLQMYSVSDGEDW